MKLKPSLIIIAGPNGSGKTSLTSQLLKHEWIEGCVYINPDNVAKEEFGDWNLPSSVLKAAKRATELRYQCLENGESLIFETVFSAEEKVDFLIKAKEKGFFIRLFFVGTNHPSINASRVARRVMEGGHEVPIQKIISRFSKSILNCEVVARLVDRLYVYDNSKDFTEPTLLFRASNGILQKEYRNVNEWADGVLQQLRQPDAPGIDPA